MKVLWIFYFIVIEECGLMDGNNDVKSGGGGKRDSGYYGNNSVFFNCLRIGIEGLFLIK